jgi:DNA (cytosine-5)-methyltransferase 1
MSRPRLLDLFCGAGGCARGYQRAGFYVVGVDNRPQPRYAGDEFHEADALAVLQRLLAGETWQGYVLGDFVGIHASPPCQGYSAANNIHSRTDHPLLIADVRTLLVATGLPYVIENVEGARKHMVNTTMLCGLTFGLNVRRHRLFECSFPTMALPCTGHERDYLIVFGQGAARTRTKQIGRTAKNGPILRRGSASWQASCDAMDIDWMSRPELSEAIPPAYTEHIGGYLMAEVQARDV